jgi:hypothetical protein
LRDFQDFFFGENQEARMSGGKYLCWLEWVRACGRPGTIGSSVFSNISLKSPLQVAYNIQGFLQHWKLMARSEDFLNAIVKKL